jgi:hypothetical protein
MTARAVPCNPHEGTQLLARRVGSAAGTSCCTDAEADGPGPNGSTRIISNAIDVERLLRPAPANDPIFFALGCPHPLTMDDSNRRADLCPRSSGLIAAPDYFTSGRPSGPRTSLPSCSTASSVIIYLTFPIISRFLSIQNLLTLSAARYVPVCFHPLRIPWPRYHFFFTNPT